MGKKDKSTFRIEIEARAFWFIVGLVGVVVAAKAVVSIFGW